jgi:hypothetical protein
MTPARTPSARSRSPDRSPAADPRAALPESRHLLLVRHLHPELTNSGFSDFRVEWHNRFQPIARYPADGDGSKQLFHGSEVAFWPVAPQAGALIEASQ